MHETLKHHSFMRKVNVRANADSIIDIVVG